MRAPANFVQEHRLGIWVVERNAAHGTVVSTQRIINELRYQVAAASSHDADVVVRIPDASASAGRMWALRWRRRFGGRLGRLRTIDPVSLAEKLEKVYKCFRYFFVWGELFVKLGFADVSMCFRCSVFHVSVLFQYVSKSLLTVSIDLQAFMCCRVFVWKVCGVGTVSAQLSSYGCLCGGCEPYSSLGKDLSRLRFSGARICRFGARLKPFSLPNSSPFLGTASCTFLLFWS